MDKMANLTLDPVKINTDLAEKFLQKNKFDDWPMPGQYMLSTNNKRNFISNNINDVCESGILEDLKPSQLPPTYIGRMLATKIEESKLLFSQLEYIIRGTDATDVSNNIKIISQFLQCSEASWNTVFGHLDKSVHIIMNKTTPLCVLGSVAIGLHVNNVPVGIVTTRKMAPICKLFTELCADLGWKIPLVFINDSEKIQFRVLRIVGHNREFGCTGVVTESADIESALDFFIDSSVTAPWRLQRIYVQESVYDEMKSALAWKCTREQVDYCIDAFATKGKIFLCDALNTKSSGDAAPVLIEAYRTVKELCALLTQHPTSFLSLWAADSQLAHEVALAAPASLVWVNEYATFDGPPQASLPIYDKILSKCYYQIEESDIKALSDLSKAWKNMTRGKRIDLIVNILQSRFSVGEDFKHVRELQDAVLASRDYSFVSVKHGKICFGVEQPLLPGDITYILVDDEKALINILNTTISGNDVIYKWLSNVLEEKYKDILESLEKAGVPMRKGMSVDVKIGPQTKSKYVIHLTMNKLKVVSTNFGTIFAN